MRRGRDFWLLLVLLAPLSPLIHYRMQQQVEDDYKTCQSHLKNLATACEMYSTDNAGRYPHKLNQLTPLYLKAIPVCPGAEPTTHRYAYECSTSPDFFSICCQGVNHQPKVSTPNYPQYFTSRSGCPER